MIYNEINGVKEITHVKVTSFVLMVAFIETILSFITAVFTLILFGITLIVTPFNSYNTIIASLNIALVVISPLISFFITLSVGYFSILLYNFLAPRIGGIKIGLNGKDLTHLPLLSFSLILALIETAWAVIISLLILALLPSLNIILNYIPINFLAYINVYLPLNPIKIALLNPLSIIELPVAAFIIGFFYNSVIALSYNYVGSKLGKIQLEFRQIKYSLYELKNVPVIPVAIAVGAILGVLGFIVEIITLIGLINFITSSNTGSLLSLLIFRSNTIIYLIPYFIIITLAAVIYNYLTQIIGGIKLKMN